MRSLTGAALCVVVLAACSDATGPSRGGFASVGAGEGFTCALTREGRAWCWGAGAFGQLGNGATAASNRPVAVGGGHRFTSLAVGNAHACGEAADSTAWCWGLNDYRELGAPTSYCNANLHFITCSDTPVRVAGTAAFDSVVASGYATCGLAASGAAYCWGWSTHGQLGVDSVRSVIPQPLPVVGAQVFRQISLDQYHACGLTPNGAAWCWGSNQHGQLGVGSAGVCPSPVTVSCVAHPVLVGVGTVFTRINAGKTHTCALDAAGAAFCWGSDQLGVLGTAQPTVGFAQVVPVAGAQTLTAIAAGADHSCAVRTDGRVLCWGLDDLAQLGAEAPAAGECPAFGAPAPCSRLPVEVALPQGVRAVQVSAGTGHTCIVDDGGDVWCWGRGTESQLGGGVAADSRVPVRVGRPE